MDLQNIESPNLLDVASKAIGSDAALLAESLGLNKEPVAKTTEAVAKTIGNIPSSTVNTGKGIMNALIHPINTIEGLYNVGSGEIANTVQSGKEAINTLQGKATTQVPINPYAEAFNEAMKGRYGSLENIGILLSQ